MTYQQKAKVEALTSCILIFVFLGGCCQQPLYKETRLMMGTFVEVVSSDKRAANIAFTEIKRIEELLSSYKDNSEVSRLNREGKLIASPQTIFVIKKAAEFWQESKGAFDITVGPLLELWGFRDKEYRIPSEEEIRDTLDKIGFGKLKISDSIVEFMVEGMKIDLGGIAKGYAVDCAIDKIRQVGIKDALINAGGDLYCLGDKFGRPWQVAIKNPYREGIQKEYLELKDKAVATSGDYEQYFIQNQKRFCHILNPKTGKPVDSGISQVTVIADDCLTADVLATSIFVLGEDKGKDLAKRFNAEVRCSK